MGKPAIKYERGNLLVPNDEYKNLTTYMRQLHEYYMAQATKMDDFGFEVIIHSPHTTRETGFSPGWEPLLIPVSQPGVRIQD